MITMLLGGLWHGAGWTFIIWGALHGGYLMINHGWQALKARLIAHSTPPGFVARTGSVALTFLAVLLAWVFFRAADAETAVRMLRGMAGLNGISLPVSLETHPWFAWFSERGGAFGGVFTHTRAAAGEAILWITLLLICLLYTSDAADE